ncbi:MAG: cadherin-like domain-containing protein, partial [Candidatus Accumulibacter sp.]|nr:cadherin-like domain-containing protein [Accumulibacter sp.]
MYDNDSQTIANTDAAGRMQRYVYDARGNLVRWTDSNGSTTNYSYTTSFDRLTGISDANGNQTRYDYNASGDLTSIVYSGGGATDQYGYDAAGNPTSWTTRNGQQIQYLYDPAGRITQKTYGDGTHVDYLYGTRGNLIETDDDSGNTRYTYDGNDYLTRIDYPGGQWLAFTYDAEGKRASSLDQTGHLLVYHYDGLDRLSRMEDEGGTSIVLYEYDAVGRLSRKSLGNGVFTTYQYDGAGQLLHLVNHNPDSSVLSFFDYTYDSRGRRIAEGTNYGHWTYTYDDIGQLTRAVLISTNAGIADQDLMYVYDALGNRSYTVENGVRTDYTTNDLNQYTKTISSTNGLTEYTFDRAGNLIREADASGTISYSYDEENRLVTADKGTDTWTYVYDARGQRVAATENGVTTFNIIDPIGLGNVVGQYAVSGQVASYDYGLGLLTGKLAGQPTTYFTFDATGSTSERTDSSRILDTYHYRPFGVRLSGTGNGPGNTFGFVGEFGVLGAASGIFSMRARFYDPELGRFMSADPIGQFIGNENIYVYAGNSPVTRIDPSGLKEEVLEYNAENWKKCYDDGGYGIPLPFAHPPAFKCITPDPPTPPSEPKSPQACGEQSVRSTSAGAVAAAAGSSNSPCSPGGGGSSGTSAPTDPNQKLAPAGFGPAGYITPSAALPYRVDFENEATATAPAQNVTITDQLDTDLDWSSFALTEIGFGDHRIAVPANTQYFETVVPVHYNNQDFEVQIEVGINLALGRVFAHFYSIDPNTSLPPDVLTGFLPPEDGTGRGMGYIAYRIDQKPGLATGTEIKNIALISFDGQPWIATNQVDPHNPAAGTDPAKEARNTIDAGAPTSAVVSLQSIRTAPDFLVTWNGADDAGGSGIASHDIYVSTDGGSYALWQDDSTATSATFSGQAGHSYAFYSVAQDNVGHIEAAPASPDASTQVVDGLAVTRAAIDTSGVSVRFNRAIEPTALNLYATETGGQGPADMTLLGASTGAVTGSLILDTDLSGFRFVKTGGVLPADTYTLTLRSAADGFFDTVNHLLDGDDDGTPGGDYLTSFAVVGPLPRVLTLPDVVRGPGQPANIPATVSGIPIRLSDGAGVESLEFTLNYDPALLTISDVTAAASLPNGSQLAANLTIPGQVRVAMSFPTPLAAGVQDILTLTAAVPASASAAYRAKQVLDLSDVSVNEGALAAVGDDAVHVVAYFGDATGNGSYSSLDGQRVLRHTVGLDSGFAAYLLADPVLVADITGNGRVSSLDATRILQEVVGIDQFEIPPLAGLVITAPGPDPYVHIPTDLSGTPGSVLTVPVLIDDAVGLESVDLRLAYDPALLEIVAVREGSATNGATIITNPAPASNANGTLVVGLALTNPRPAGGGSLLEIDFRIRPTAASGSTALNLTQVSLNEDGLVLTPLPVPGQDGSDGLLTIRSATGNTAPVTTDDGYTTAEDTPLSIAAPGVLGNDSDVDGDSLTTRLVDSPTHGTLTLNADGGFLYTPDADYFGSDSF